MIGDLLRAGSSQPSGGSWQPPSPEELQCQFPQYEIRGILGRGGMGAVYKGWQKSLQRFVAIKILPPGLDDGGMNFAARFKQEARAMAKFKHPGIVGVHDAGETPEGLLYFIMEYVEGKDVTQLIAEGGKLPSQEALNITIRVCEALAYAHERGVIHRDIKPSNVMIEVDGTVKVADFGLAKLSSADSTVNTLSNLLMGTPDFMPPEALHGSGNADHRGDIYAVGGMLYQMLTGKAPHGRFEPPSHVVPGLDKRLDSIVDKAMHADSAKRYSSAIELQAAIEPITRDISKRVATSAHRDSGTRRNNLLLTLSSATIILVLFGAWMKHSRVTVDDPRWRKLVFAEEGVWPKADGGASLTPDGGLHVKGGFDLPDFDHRNAALRGEIRLSKVITDPYVQLRRTTDGSSRQFSIYRDSASQRLGNASEAGVLLTKFAYPASFIVTDHWVPFEFAVIGDASIAKLGSFRLPVAHSKKCVGPGGAQLFGNVDFRNLEYIDLDALTETEALKLLGVDATSSAASPSPQVSHL